MASPTSSTKASGTPAQLDTRNADTHDVFVRVRREPYAVRLSMTLPCSALVQLAVAGIAPENPCGDIFTTQSWHPNLKPSHRTTALHKHKCAEMREGFNVA
ncbi:hypothetical protein ACW7G0_09375 [Lysobacter sp. A286]